MTVVPPGPKLACSDEMNKVDDVSVMLVQSHVIVDDQWRETTMMRSPPMSSYLVYFIVCDDFAYRSSVLDNGVPVRCIRYDAVD